MWFGRCLGAESSADVFRSHADRAGGEEEQLLQVLGNAEGALVAVDDIKSSVVPARDGGVWFHWRVVLLRRHVRLVDNLDRPGQFAFHITPFELARLVKVDLVRGVEARMVGGECDVVAVLLVVDRDCVSRRPCLLPGFGDDQYDGPSQACGTRSDCSTRRFGSGSAKPAPSPRRGALPECSTVSTPGIEDAARVSTVRTRPRGMVDVTIQP